MTTGRINQITTSSQDDCARSHRVTFSLPTNPTDQQPTVPLLVVVSLPRLSVPLGLMHSHAHTAMLLVASTSSWAARATDGEALSFLGYTNSALGHRPSAQHHAHSPPVFLLKLKPVTCHRMSAGTDVHATCTHTSKQMDSNDLRALPSFVDPTVPTGYKMANTVGYPVEKHFDVKRAIRMSLNWQHSFIHTVQMRLDLNVLCLHTLRPSITNSVDPPGWS